MKKLSLVILACVFAVACGGNSKRHHAYGGRSDLYFDVEDDGYDEDDEEYDRLVYICTGPDAYAYHYDEDCWAIQQCSEDIEEVLLSDVIDKREPCSQCVW